MLGNPQAVMNGLVHIILICLCHLSNNLHCIFPSSFVILIEMDGRTDYK